MTLIDGNETSWEANNRSWTLGIKANRSKLDEFEVLVIGSLDMADWET